MLLERDTELACVDAALRTADTGTSSLILVTGPLGIGRSALLRHLPDLAADQDVRVLRANAAPMEQDFAFGVVHQLLDSLPTAAPEEAPERHTAEAGTDPTTPFHGTADAAPGTIPADPRSLLDEAGPHPRLLILVDDLQWVDAPSLRWLAHLARLVEREQCPNGLSVVVVCTLRDGDDRARHPLVREVADTFTRTLRPAPLSLDATRTLIHARYGLPGHEEYARACHEASAGNPLFLMSLLRGMVARGVAPTAEHSASVRALCPPDLRERLASLLRTQPPAVRDLAAAIAAFGDQGDPALVRRLSGLDEKAFADARRAMYDIGLLADACEPRFIHRVVRDAVESSMSPSERERSHTAAADMLHRLGRPHEEVAAHLTAVSTVDPPWSVAVLRDAADAALRRGAPRTAARYLRHALPHHHTQDERRARLLIDLATAERGYDPEACERHIAQATSLLTTPQDRAAAALRIPPALLGTTSPLATGLLRRAAAELGEPASLDGPTRETALRIEARLRHRGHESPAELASAAVRLREMGEEPPLGSAAERELTAVLLCSGTLTGRLSAAEAARTANRILEREPAASARVHTALPLVAITLFAAESVQVLDSWLTTEQENRRRHATGADDVLLFVGRALVLVSQGRLTQAREHVERVMGLADTDWREISIIVLSAVALELRDPALSEQILARGRGRRSAGPALVAALQILQASVDAQQGLRSRALENLLACGRQLDGFGWQNSALFPWRPHAIGLYHRLGDWRAAMSLAEEEHAWATEWGAPTGLGRALRLKGWLRDGEGVPLLREAVDVLRGSPYELELARTLMLLGRRLGSGQEAEAVLREAGALAAACGAPWLVERAGLGLGTAALPQKAVLTRSERRVLSLVGRGLTNQEIAGELGVSSRAVEKHLTNSYRKLGVSGRHELAGALPA
ncbi:ATP-binding protein [Streptomyces niveus]|uniref:ATP-binding protein n=1 Tax=Streptomyces niveus TaxID=193462 RepID=UPI0036D2ADAE